MKKKLYTIIGTISLIVSIFLCRWGINEKKRKEKLKKEYDEIIEPFLDFIIQVFDQYEDLDCKFQTTVMDYMINKKHLIVKIEAFYDDVIDLHLYKGDTNGDEDDGKCIFSLFAEYAGDGYDISNESFITFTRMLLNSLNSEKFSGTDKLFVNELVGDLKNYTAELIGFSNAKA